nr:hypothetical protein [candidate division Zixibacteria bacterium]
MIKTIIRIFGLILLPLLSLVDAETGDPLEMKKQEYSRAAMIQLEVEIVVVSDVFDEIDTSRGEITIASDDRYRADINDDFYLFDGTCIREYSAENAQVTLDCLKEGEYFENQLSFIKDFDHCYKTEKSNIPGKYRLTKIPECGMQPPDSLTISIDKKSPASIEYFDLNGDLNRINILKETFYDSIDDDIFNLRLPDSVEVIELL